MFGAAGHRVVGARGANSSRLLASRLADELGARRNARPGVIVLDEQPGASMAAGIPGCVTAGPGLRAPEAEFTGRWPHVAFS